MEASKKLVLFTSLPRVGGHSSLTFGLSRLMRPHFDELEIWCKVMPEHGHSDALAAELGAMGCRVRMLSDLRGRLRLSALAGFLLSRMRRRPDVFFTMAMRNLSPVLARASGAPLSVYYQITHDLTPATIAMLEGFSATFARMVFICPATFDDFPGATARPERFSWIPQSSEIPVPDRASLPAEREARISGDTPIRLGLIGRLTPEKGAAALLDYADRSTSRCEIHVAGSGPLEREFQRRSENPREAGPKVRFHGSFDPASRKPFLREFFGGIDRLVVASQDEWETLSMAALEALQHGVPSVICRTGGLRSFAHPGLGPAPEKVIRLVDPSDLAGSLDSLCRAGREPWESVGAACLEHYDRWFSDDAIGGRWRDLLLGPDPTASR